MKLRRSVVIAAAAFAVLPATAGAANSERVCHGAPQGSADCHARVVTDGKGQPLATAGPSGLNPADLQDAYKLAGASGGGRTIAIVDAYDDPTAEADLGVYRSQFGLPPCTTANGCFTKINQRGTSTPPRVNAGWAQEISLDLDMASAICPDCKILLVEGDSASFTDLGAAVNKAAALGADAISNSYGAPEFSQETQSTYASPYNHPGTAITASTGDSGYGVQFPAASPTVIAVGGTSLKRASNSRGWTETAWSGAGSGCSAYITRPSWQNYAGCSKRSVADVSAVADPNTGVSVYDSTRYQGMSGWLRFGGTSASAPIIGALSVIGNHIASDASYLYSHTSSLFDVVGGSNGSCGGSWLCTAVAGYDGPTGLGTPNGAGAF